MLFFPPLRLVAAAPLCFCACADLADSHARAQPFRLPTANTALFDSGGGAGFFVGTTGKPWTSGTFGCVRSEGWQFHEGLDIRCVSRDKKQEPADPILAVADGVVAYANKRATLSNYGNYLVIMHRVEGLEIFSLYAHLKEIRPGLEYGTPVKAGDVVALMGRTSNTREQISRERAHLHFELNLFVNDHFSGWYKKFLPQQKNDHGEYNGLNLLGLDPAAILREQRAAGKNFSLVKFIRQQPELCRLFVRKAELPWVKRYAPLVTRNPTAEREGVAGYELSLNYTGIPCRIIPRAASEVGNIGRIQLLSVNETEQKKHPCRKLVAKRGTRWELTSHGTQHVELLLF